MLQMGYANTCEDCGTIFAEKARYCPACGCSRHVKSLYRRPLPAGIPYDPSGKFEYCAQCGNREIRPRSSFCHICGAPLRNPCIPAIGRVHYNPSNARFCGECGCKTLFNISRIHLYEKEVTNMFYSDGVPYDPKTMKVKICPRCKNEEFSDSSDYCRICGTNLYNLCEGGPSYNPRDGEYPGQSNQHKNPSNARFCEKCGKPTVYSKNGILKDFLSVLNQSSEE